MENGKIAQNLMGLLAGRTKNINLTTYEVRRVVAKEFSKLKSKDISDVMELCESLLETRTWAMGVIAYDWAFRVRDQYNKEVFGVFEHWLKEYVTGWGDCDDFCAHAFGALLGKYNELFTKVTQWTSSDNFCMRRASAVILIYPIRKNRFEAIDPFVISDQLMDDDNRLVQKGCGWMLKVLSERRKDEVIAYLINNKSRVPRLTLRYAIEKMSYEESKMILGT